MFSALLVSSVLFANGSKEAAPVADAAEKSDSYHIGIVTGTVSQSEDD